MTFEQCDPCTAFIKRGLVVVTFEGVGDRSNACVHPCRYPMCSNKLSLATATRWWRDLQIWQSFLKGTVLRDVLPDGNAGQSAKCDVRLPFETVKVATEHPAGCVAWGVDPEDGTVEDVRGPLWSGWERVQRKFGEDRGHVRNADVSEDLLHPLNEQQHSGLDDELDEQDDVDGLRGAS